MPIGVQVLYLAVVGPLVRDVKRSGNRAAVRVEAAFFEEVAIQVLVEVVDGIVKRQQYNLRHGIDAQAAYRKYKSAQEIDDSFVAAFYVFFVCDTTFVFSHFGNWSVLFLFRFVGLILFACGHVRFSPYALSYTKT